MIFRLRNFIFDEKDIFILILVALMVIAGVMHIPLEPFRYSSLVVTVVYLLATRIMLGQINLQVYLAVTFTGLLLSMLLSPYGLAIFYAVGLFLYTRSNV